MTKSELIQKLAMLTQRGERGDFEEGHAVADDLLLEFINDDEIADAFDAVGKWYA